MPTRSLHSRVMKWPDRATVDAAARQWSHRIVTERDDVVRVGYFGSYARGDWGVGSDLDLVAVVRQSQQPFHERARRWDRSELPVPADLLVYTEAEWTALDQRGGRFAEMLRCETVWLDSQS